MVNHVAFIAAAYGVTVAIVGTLVVTTIVRHRTLLRALAKVGGDEARAP